MARRARDPLLRCWSRCAPVLPGVLLVALGTLSGLPAHGQSAALPLRCRLEMGPWQPCAMVVEQPGERWAIQVAGRRIAFQHDGRGTVTMQDPALGRPGHTNGWIPVQTTWIDGPALCWNGVCTQGEFPLD
ncbi:MAG: hypothetical protein VKK63_01140 [Synechococcus sp.]|nr:hypothetical protein [Synechococcus sp.]